jgi:hypothetical protein
MKRNKTSNKKKLIELSVSQFHGFVERLPTDRPFQCSFKGGKVFVDTNLAPKLRVVLRNLMRKKLSEEQRKMLEEAHVQCRLQWAADSFDEVAAWIEYGRTGCCEFSDEELVEDAFTHQTYLHVELRKRDLMRTTLSCHEGLVNIHAEEFVAWLETFEESATA